MLLACAAEIYHGCLSDGLSKGNKHESSIADLLQVFAALKVSHSTILCLICPCCMLQCSIPSRALSRTCHVACSFGLASYMLQAYLNFEGRKGAGFK